jgi:DNA-binding MarR family transcriptional regulator
MSDAGKREAGEDGLGDVLDLMRVMWSVDHRLQRLSKRMAAGLGVTGPQRLVLRLLGREPGLSPAGLAAALQLHPSTVTGIVQRLERAGLVRRRPDPADGRRSLLVLSPRGRRLVDPAPGTVEAAMSAAVRSCPKAELASTRRLLAAVARELERALADGDPRPVSGAVRDGR